MHATDGVYLRRVAAATAIVGIILGGAAALLVFGRTFLLLFTGVLLAILLQAVVQAAMQRLHLGHKTAVGLVTLLFFVVLAGLLALFGPLFADGFNQLFDALAGSIDSFIATLREHGWGKALLSGDGSGMSMLSSAFKTAAGFAGVALWALTAVLVVIIIGLYLNAEPHTYANALVRLLPERHRSDGHRLVSEMYHNLRWWLAGRLASMAVVGVLTWLGLVALGMPLSLTLALLAALLSFIPNIGPILSAVPAVLVGLQESPATAAYVTALYIAVQTVESYLITPLIQRRAVALPPGLVIGAQLVAATAYGTIGLLTATPLTVLIVVAVKTLWLPRADRAT